MKKADWTVLHKQLCDRLQELSQAKGTDYTGSVDDQFYNFRKGEAFGLKTSDGFIARMLDKMSRIASFNQTGSLQVKTESVEDTLLDLANYSLLFVGYLREQQTPEAIRGLPRAQLGIERKV